MPTKQKTPVRNAIEAKRKFEDASSSFLEIEKAEGGSNRYRLQFEGGGFSALPMDDSIVVETNEVWSSDDRIYMDVTLWHERTVA